MKIKQDKKSMLENYEKDPLENHKPALVRKDKKTLSRNSAHILLNKSKLEPLEKDM